MKKLLKGIVCLILIVMIVGVATSTVRTITKNRKKPESTTYRITYKVAGSGEDLTKNFSWLMKENGSYPESYEKKKGATVDALAGSQSSIWEDFEPGENELPLVTISSYVYDPNDCDHWAWFIGWYYDSECTKEFDGKIAAGTKGDVTLYAKIGEDFESNWTKFY